MARKETVTKKIIIESAFQMTKEEGFSLVTARKLANKIGCSTQPIFRVFENMTELRTELFRMSMEFFEEYFMEHKEDSQVPFMDLGMAYIQFAQEESNVFQLLFLSKDRDEKSLYELLNGSQGAVKNEIQKAIGLGCGNPGELFMKMWIFIHGAACMSITGDYDLSKDQTRDLLKESYYAYDKK